MHHRRSWAALCCCVALASACSDEPTSEEPSASAGVPTTAPTGGLAVPEGEARGEDPVGEAAAEGAATEEAATEEAAVAEPADENGWVDLLHTVETIVAASSVYRNEHDQVARLYDGDLETAWNSVSATVPNQLFEIRFRLPRDVRVHAIELTVGFTRPPGERDLFTENRRIKSIFIFHDGEQVAHPTLDIENRGLQRIPIEGSGGDWRFSVDEWEPGTRANYREIVISELRVLGVAGPSAPRASTPTALVGFLPRIEIPAADVVAPAIRDPRLFGEELVGVVYPELEFENEDPPVRLVNPRPVITGSFSSGVARVPIQLPAGKCYAIGGLVGRSGAASASPLEASFDDIGGETVNGYSRGFHGLFVIGADAPLCATEGPMNAMLVIEDARGAKFSVIVYEQRGMPAD